MRFCGEIQYDGHSHIENNPHPYWVHSDICFNCYTKDSERMMDEEYKKFLHDCLDEWLNQSNGTGAFWVGDPVYMKDNFTQEEI